MVGPRDIRNIRTDSLESMGVPDASDEVLIRDVTDGVVKIANVSDVGITDHGSLGGLADFTDDHGTEHDSHDHSTAMGTVVITDISDVNITAVASPDFLAWSGSAWVNREITTSDVTSGTFANARISQSSVTQHEAALTITESQISDLLHYQTSNFNTDFAAKSTTDLSEGTNLYYTDARVNADIDARVTKAFVDALNVDADTLDSLDSTQFLRSDVSDSATGIITFQSGAIVEDDIATNYAATGVLGWTDNSLDQLIVRNPNNADPNNFSSIYFYTAGSSGNATGRIVLTNGSGGNSEFRWLLRDSAHTDFTNEKMVLDSDGTLFINGNRALTVADEGSGNGLDADTLDGEHASAFADAIHTHDTSDVVSGIFAVARIPDLDAAKITTGTFADARISQSSVTQHEASLTLTQSQISDLDISEQYQDDFGTSFFIAGGNLTGTYDDVANTYTLDVTGTFADSFITQSSVTQHEAALTITESQISDLGSYLPLSGGTITGSLTVNDKIVAQDAIRTSSANGQYTATNRATLESGNGATGAIVINLNIPRGDEMGTHRLYGYNYVETDNIIDVRWGLYNYTVNTTWPRKGFVNMGSSPTPNRVRAALDGSGNVVYIVGETTDTWNYLQLMFETTMWGFSGVGSDLATTPTMSLETSLAAYTDITDIARGTDLYYKNSQLNIVANPDVSLAQGSGALVVGPATGSNLGIDGNEIQSRSNTSAETLNLNLEGGLVQIGSGGLDVNGTGNFLNRITATDGVSMYGLNFENGDAATGDSLILRTTSNPGTGDTIFQVRSSGQAVRLEVDHAGHTTADRFRTVEAGTEADPAYSYGSYTDTGMRYRAIDGVRSTELVANGRAVVSAGYNGSGFGDLTLYFNGEVGNYIRFYPSNDSFTFGTNAGSAGQISASIARLDAAGSNTTSNSANAYVSSGGNISRVTSLRETKANIRAFDGERSGRNWTPRLTGLETPEEKFMQIRPVVFNSNNEQDPDDVDYMGYVAEELEPLYPELVNYTEDGELMGVNYDRVSTIIVDVVQRILKRLEAAGI